MKWSVFANWSFQNDENEKWAHSSDKGINVELENQYL